jgi:beta-xylosidase
MSMERHTSQELMRGMSGQLSNYKGLNPRLIIRFSPGIQLAEVDLETGIVGEWTTVWNGTGGTAPEGPHLYMKDGWYYLMIAEGMAGPNYKSA